MRATPNAGVPRLGRAVCAAIFFGAFAVRLAAIAAVGFSTMRFGDAPAYLLGAKALAETGHYPLRTDSYLFRPPGFPFLLAVSTFGHPDAIPAAKVVNATVGALGALLVAALSARIFRRRGLAIAAGLLAALHPSLVLASSDLQSEPLFVALLLSAGYLLLAATDRPSSNLAVLAGVFLALAALTRSSALVLAPLLLAPLRDVRHPSRANAHIAFSALLGFGLALAPWTLRNALVFRELIVVNDGAGYVFYGRNADAALPLARARDRAELQVATDGLERDRVERILSLPEAVRSSPGRLSRALTSAAIAQRRADPRGTLRLLAWKTWDWLRPYPDPRFWPRPAVLAVGVYMAALFTCAGIGFLRAPRTGVSAFCLVFLAATMLVHVVLETNWRYRAANWDPVLLLYASFGVATLLPPGRRRAAAPHPA
jgi:4-amino-4-deoxy-L-arabinose transferase-like glycosyltransferase